MLRDHPLEEHDIVEFGAVADETVVTDRGVRAQIGLRADDAVAAELGGLRWVGAVLLAWSITGIAVMARPEGRGVFVTAGAAQLTMGALAFLYSWSLNEYGWSTWYQALCSVVLVGGAVYLWWARLSGRKVLRGPVEEEGTQRRWFRR